jgi:hypothetical protein
MNFMMHVHLSGCVQVCAENNDCHSKGMLQTAIFNFLTKLDAEKNSVQIT